MALDAIRPELPSRAATPRPGKSVKFLHQGVTAIGLFGLAVFDFCVGKASRRRLFRRSAGGHSSTDAASIRNIVVGVSDRHTWHNSWEEKSAKQGLSGEEVSQCQTIRELRFLVLAAVAIALVAAQAQAPPQHLRRAGQAGHRFVSHRLAASLFEFRVATARKSSSRICRQNARAIQSGWPRRGEIEAKYIDEAGTVANVVTGFCTWCNATRWMGRGAGRIRLVGKFVAGRDVKFAKSSRRSPCFTIANAVYL